MSRNLSLGFAVVWAVGCSEYEVKPGGDPVAGAAPEILVDPGSLTFGQLATGEQEVQTFSVKNVGNATLNVSDVVIGSGIAFTILGPETTFDLEPEESTTVDVAFSPMGANENFGQALVMSDDLINPQAPVDLLGLGAVPELKIEPPTYVFGDTFVPCGASIDLTLSNVGSEDLRIDSLDYRSGGLLTLDATAVQSELPLTLAPGEQRVVTVYFTPTTIGSDTGVLDVTSNDPRGVVSADQNGEGAYSDENTEVFTEPGIPPVDVMMLIDHSCSMSENNTDDVESGIPLFVNELTTVADWQMIEVTQNDGCANGGLITPATPNPAQLLIDHAWDGPQTSQLTEALLELASIALDQTGPGGCNAGFLRPGALLHIVVMSDEKDHSGHPADYWLADYQQHASSPDYVKVSAIADINVNCGDGTGAKGYEEAADLSGGSKLNICNANWGANFGDIASGVLAGIRTYNLSDPAVPETVVVTVNGVPATDFDYTPGTNSVTINEPPVGEGDLVEVTYSVLATCE
ncbi:MAG: choice-of-anchor D domain-containing protein [Myxococcota bacterium]